MSPGRRPADLARELLRDLDASEERRQRRARDTTPDKIGFALRHDLLERLAREDPAPDDLEAWLFARCREAAPASGPLRAIALDVFARWRGPDGPA